MSERFTGFGQMSDERWAEVPGYDGAYEVSDQGRVRSWRNDSSREQPFELTYYKFPRGYIQVELKRPTRRVYVHVLVLEAFVGPRPEGHESGHLNGNPSDNRLANLAWVTPKVNGEHRAIHGTQIRGEASKLTSLTEGHVRSIRKAHTEGWSTVKLARGFGVSRTAISQIIRRKTWAHI